ncbi:MAG: formylglycine-generating enzyme family protein [Leptolyngbya sp. SIO1E4]|nr:formylglycine-generating enzyme family protein [Leptolyngbya sp. SIO1E4]
MPELVAQRERRKTLYVTEPLGSKLGLDIVIIPGGSFLMGSPDDDPDRLSNGSEEPQYLVTVPTFLMGRYPVTQAQWQFVAGLKQKKRKLDPNPAHFKGDVRPVESVSWDDAVEFCDRLSIHSGREYRLPTEAEWEYACRAGTTTPYHFGESINTNLANYNGKYKGTTAVDHFGIANAFGLSDMHGNVWEWCLDHWHDSYEGAPTDGSTWVKDGEDAYRVLRGGSWDCLPWHCRSASRDAYTSNCRTDDYGFRVVCVAPRTLP